MIKVRRIRYATFETLDMDKAVGYYTQVNGLMLETREKGRAFLATRTGELAIELEQGQKGRLPGSIVRSRSERRSRGHGPAAFQRGDPERATP